mmetsp:Transcript_92422/g.261650  ORF Transcript_92422/g.261650 Transcript_92422/m.261650 type:complete len:330 (-) Transcript_92422:580-1569(-)
MSRSTGTCLRSRSAPPGQLEALFSASDISATILSILTCVLAALASCGGADTSPWLPAASTELSSCRTRSYIPCAFQRCASTSSRLCSRRNFSQSSTVQCTPLLRISCSLGSSARMSSFSSTASRARWSGQLSPMLPKGCWLIRYSLFWKASRCFSRYRTMSAFAMSMLAVSVSLSSACCFSCILARMKSAMSQGSGAPSPNEARLALAARLQAAGRYCCQNTKTRATWKSAEYMKWRNAFWNFSSRKKAHPASMWKRLSCAFHCGSSGLKLTLNRSSASLIRCCASSFCTCRSKGTGVRHETAPSVATSTRPPPASQIPTVAPSTVSVW